MSGKAENIMISCYEISLPWKYFKSLAIFDGTHIVISKISTLIWPKKITLLGKVLKLLDITLYLVGKTIMS